jgi:hypothetical protein
MLRPTVYIPSEVPRLACPLALSFEAQGAGIDRQLKKEVAVLHDWFAGGTPSLKRDAER